MTLQYFLYSDQPSRKDRQQVKAEDFDRKYQIHDE